MTADRSRADYGPTASPGPIDDIPLRRNLLLDLAVALGLIVALVGLFGGGFAVALLFKSILPDPWHQIGGVCTVAVTVVVVFIAWRSRNLRAAVEAVGQEEWREQWSRMSAHHVLNLASDARTLARRLARAGHGGRTIRAAGAKQLARVRPFEQIFEPQLVDEASQTVRDMMLADSDRASAAGETSSDAQTIRVIQRNVKLGGGWFGVIMLVIMIVIVGTYAVGRNTRLYPLLAIWIAVLFVRLFVGRRTGGSRGGWYAVPGGVVARRESWIGISREFVVFQRTECVLLLSASRQPNLWAVHVARGDGVRSTTVLTPTEAAFLLAAWTSPVPTPPAEQVLALL